MKKQLVATLFIIAVPFFFVSCVSSILKERPPSFSTEIRLTAPKAPFAKTETSVFPTWKNSQTGNVISIVSDCNDGATNKLSTLHQLIEDSLEEINVVKEETMALQNRPALLKILTASLDGQPIEVRSVSFKRKSCGYLASLSGKPNSLLKDTVHFDHFIQSFGFE